MRKLRLRGEQLFAGLHRFQNGVLIGELRPLVVVCGLLRERGQISGRHRDDCDGPARMLLHLETFQKPLPARD
jgi:hypothetical protein